MRHSVAKFLWIKSAGARKRLPNFSKAGVAVTAAPNSDRSRPNNAKQHLALDPFRPCYPRLYFALCRWASRWPAQHQTAFRRSYRNYIMTDRPQLLTSCMTHVPARRAGDLAILRFSKASDEIRPRWVARRKYNESALNLANWCRRKLVMSFWGGWITISVSLQTQTLDEIEASAISRIVTTGDSAIGNFHMMQNDDLVVWTSS